MAWDQTKWIERMIDGRFDFVTEEWIKEAYKNSIKVDHDPLQNILADFRQLKIERGRLDKTAL